MVESTVGEGTTFTIKLPIHPEKAPQDVVEQAEKND
jgi:signal transduction histidine kinase